MYQNLIAAVAPVLVDFILILVLSPLAVLLAGHLAGVEKASALRAIAIALFGLLSLVLLVLDLVLSLAHTFISSIPLAPFSLQLSIPQRLAIYFVVWIVLIKIGFESSFVDAFAVGVSTAVLLIIITAIIIFVTTPIWTGLFGG
jgi:hypothetical protein